MFTPHNRRSIRLKDYDYSQSGLYFVTICVKNRMLLFGNVQDGQMSLSEFGVCADNCWNAIPSHFPNVVLHEYVVMPNHIHGIIEIVDAGNDGAKNGNIVGAISGDNVGAKNLSPLQTNFFLPPQQTPPQTGNYPSPHETPEQTPPRPRGTSRTVGSIIRGFKIGVTKEIGFSPWQRNYYEHIIHDRNAYNTISEYIGQNPLKWEMDCFYGNE